MRTLALVLVMCAVAAHAGTMRCFVREHEWVDDEGLGWAAEIDTISEHPDLLELAALSFKPVVAGTSGCVHRQHFNDIQLGWAVQAGATVPFASYPTHCDDRIQLSFGVSTMGSEVWGEEPRHVTDGELFAPHDGRVDMQTGTTNVRQHATRWRRLTVRWATGSRREPVATPFTVHVCVMEHDNAPPLEVDMDAWREVDPPRILPLAECVREFGGHCGANVGWAAEERVELRAHTDVNRLHPTRLENGWHLPSAFDAGVHKPGSLKPHFHFGWHCETGVGDSEAKWHLDGYTLHLDHLAARCNDPLADEQPGKSFVWSTKDEDNMDSYKVHSDHVNVLPAQYHPKQKPHTQIFTEAEAKKAWKHAGVDEPVLAEAHSHGRRQEGVAAEGCCGYGCCTDCSGDDYWWVWLIFLLVLLLVPGCILFVAWATSWDLNDWHYYEDPAPRTSTTVQTRYYADQADYKRTHGRDPPVHTHNVTQQTTTAPARHHHRYYPGY